MYPLFSGDESDAATDVPRLVVSLRIRGDSLDPDFLTQQLGIPPTSSARMGEAPDDGRTRAHATGDWTYRLPVPPETELGEVLEQLLTLFPADVTLWEELTSTYAVDVCCELYLEADLQRTMLDASVLGALGRRGLALRMLLHAPDGDAGRADDEADDEDEAGDR